MSSNYTDTYKIFAQKMMKSKSEDIRRWATQNENPVLKQLAQEVLDIIEHAERKGL